LNVSKRPWFSNRVGLRLAGKIWKGGAIVGQIIKNGKGLTKLNL
jgi:hypothetical protein